MDRAFHDRSDVSWDILPGARNDAYIIAVRKHIVTQNTLTGGNKGIGVEESAEFGIIVPGLQVIEAAVSVVHLTPRGN